MLYLYSKTWLKNRNCWSLDEYKKDEKILQQQQRRAARPSSNQVSTFPLAKKVVVAVTVKLAIGLDEAWLLLLLLLVCGVLGRVLAARRDTGRKEGRKRDEPRRGASRAAWMTLILITFYEAVSDLCQVLATP